MQGWADAGASPKAAAEAPTPDQGADPAIRDAEALQSAAADASDAADAAESRGSTNAPAETTEEAAPDDTGSITPAPAPNDEVCECC
jgi:hypothetical protein